MAWCCHWAGMMASWGEPNYTCSIAYLMRRHHLTRQFFRSHETRRYSHVLGKGGWARSHFHKGKNNNIRTKFGNLLNPPASCSNLNTVGVLNLLPCCNNDHIQDLMHSCMHQHQHGQIQEESEVIEQHQIKLRQNIILWSDLKITFPQCQPKGETVLNKHTHRSGCKTFAWLQ